MVNHGPTSHSDTDCQYENQPWPTMLQYHVVTRDSLYMKIMVNHGPMPHSKKYCLDMKTSHGQHDQACLF